MASLGPGMASLGLETTSQLSGDSLPETGGPERTSRRSGDGLPLPGGGLSEPVGNLPAVRTWPPSAKR